MPASGYKDVVVLVAGRPVCVGDMRYAAEALGVSYESLRTYLYSDPLEGTCVRRLESLWVVEGCRYPVTTDVACRLVGCSPDEVRHIANRQGDGRVRRYRRQRWSLPYEVIDELRDADRRRRSKRKGRSGPGGTP